jgi:hypothetical protein
MLNVFERVNISGTPGKWLRRAAIIVLVSALVASASPFGTSDMDIGPRFAYWLGGISVGWAQWMLIIGVLHRTTGANPWPPGVAGSVAAVLFAAVMAVEIYAVRTWLIDVPPGNGTAPFLAILVAMLAYCWLGQLLVRLASGGPPAPPMESDRGTEVRFLKRIPDHIAGNLLCLRTEDHYLRIHTSAGQDLILCRMKDALLELAGADGMQVHRSYWVARGAVTNVERIGRKTTLILSNGLRVPVSESFLPAVRDAGWLD